MAANMFGQSVGWLTAAMLAVVLADKGQWGWRTLYGLGALPGVLLLLVLPWLPVSVASPGRKGSCSTCHACAASRCAAPTIERLL